MREQDDEECELQDKHHAQEYILLIELQQQYIDGIGVEASAYPTAVPEQAIDVSAHTTIDSCE